MPGEPNQSDSLKNPQIIVLFLGPREKTHGPSERKLSPGSGWQPRGYDEAADGVPEEHDGPNAGELPFTRSLKEFKMSLMTCHIHTQIYFFVKNAKQLP